MASIAAATAPTSLGLSEMLGTAMNSKAATRTAPAPSSAGSAKIVSLFSRKKAAAPPSFSPCQLPASISLLHHLITETKFYTRRLWALSEMATLSPATLPSAAVSCSSSLNSSMRKKSGVACIEGLSSFGGLKAHNGVSNLGLPACTAQSFAMVVSSLKSSSQGKKGKGGALSSTCNAASEIFKIAAIVNGLVVIGVAVGFVILRVEAALEEEE